MTIHIFNPEHDLALAADNQYFTAPHAGRGLRSDLSFIPAAWAEDGDIVVADDIDAAEESYRRSQIRGKPRVEFCTMVQLPHVLSHETSIVGFDVWGWDSALRFQLTHAGVPAEVLPTDEYLRTVRELSSRIHTTAILRKVREGMENVTCGESLRCNSYEDIMACFANSSDKVIKAPWSSSGRGVRYLSEKNLNLNNWITNTLVRQGYVMVEPYYNKVRDFGMEFRADADGKVSYLGLSLFETKNGAYTGNLLATEDEKREIISKYFDLTLLDEVCHRVVRALEEMIDGRYQGMMGVDMMVVANEGDGYLIHPCVEVNLRRTMGHVALALSPEQSNEKRLMNVDYDGKYHLKIKKL